MKKNKFLLMMTLCLTLSSCESCKENEWNELPPETQKGANTFGCYVNGKLFVVKSRLAATYFKSSNSFSVGGYSADGSDIGIYVMNVEENTPIVISVASYAEFKNRNRVCPQFYGRDNGEVILTRFDTINNIVSGRFHFQSQCAGVSDEIIGDSTVFITNGRFDAKLIVNN